MPGELILLKGAGNLHLERLMLMFFTSDTLLGRMFAGEKSHCPPKGRNGLRPLRGAV